MKTGKKFILTVVIFIFFISSAAFADTVVLKNGRELKVAKTWQEGDQLCFIFHGMKVGIPQSKISRIESDSEDQNKAIARKNQAKYDLKRISRKSAEDLTRGPAEDTARTDSDSSGAAIPTQPCSAIRKDGFCDLQWGRKVSSVDGLKIRQTISDLDDVAEYVRPKDFLKIGDAALESVIYSFWQDQLYTVTVWTKDYSNFTALRDAVFKELGPGIRNDSTRERYLWSDALSDIMLDYTQDGRHGMLWLRSKELDHRCKSSQLKGPASYLKWMRSRDLVFSRTTPGKNGPCGALRALFIWYIYR
jgi:hypothetical protein